MKASKISTALGGLITVALLSRCSAIDSRDLKVVTEDAGQPGSGGSGGKGGKGGTAGKGGTGGSTVGGTGGTAATSGGGSAGKGGSASGGSAGKGGSAGGGSGGKSGSSSGGSAGKGGSAGTGGSAGSVKDCDGNALTPAADTIKACLLQIGCDPLYAVTTMSFCISSQRLKTFSQDDCGTGADTCDGYLKCSGHGYYDAYDCSDGQDAYCDGTYAVYCLRYPYAYDCARVGGVCQTYTNSDGTVGASCRQPAEDGCTDPADASLCDGQIAYSCVDGYGYGTDCEARGSKCQDGACYYVLPSCTTPGSTCGTATRADICYDDMTLARYSCAAGLGCTAGTDSARCLAPGCTDTTACKESCSGTNLTFCYGAVPVTVDCADYGFKSCLETTLDDNTTPSARCYLPTSAADSLCDPIATDSTCTACDKAKCCKEETACLDDSGCVDYISCVNDCADSTCTTGCGTTYSAGKSVFTKFSNCSSTNCSVECG